MLNYSVIIPHKNIPQLLQRCLTSIPQRTDLEVIIVDDNSDSNKVDFEHFPGCGRSDTKILFTKEGRGAGFARNKGLEAAQGKWLIFADSDDYFNYCINDILDEYQNNDADIIYFKHTAVYSDSYLPVIRTKHNEQVEMFLAQKKNAEAALRYHYSEPWSKLVRRSLITEHSIRFDELSCSNDVTFSYLTGFYAKTIAADNRALYCTTIRKDSISYSPQTPQKRLDGFHVAWNKYHFCREHNLPLMGYQKTVLKRFVKICLLDHLNPIKIA